MSFNLNSIAFSPKSKNSPSKTSPLPKSSQTLNTSRTQKTLTLQYLQKKFEELYLENQKWTAKKQKIREEKIMIKEEEELKECTFQPMINPEIQLNGSNPSSFLKREMDWVQKKQKKIEDLCRFTEQKLKQECSFRPKISSKTSAILNKSHKIQTSRNLFNQHTQTPQHKQKKGGCYRQIHMKQEGYKELQKANSAHHFMLMTERRFATKMAHFEQEYLKGEDFDQFNSRMGFMTSRPNFKFTEDEDYIENILIKTDEQNTLDSATELELKTIKKNDDIDQVQQQNEEEKHQNQVIEINDTDNQEEKHQSQQNDEEQEVRENKM